jgi:hypothetical protein
MAWCQPGWLAMPSFDGFQTRAKAGLPAIALRRSIVFPAFFPAFSPFSWAILHGTRSFARRRGMLPSS